jgi:hypothetical protein
MANLGESSATVLPVRREPEFFGDTELTLLYMARLLRDALKLEELLTAGGVEYTVETGTYTSGFLIRRELTGAYFYVSPTDEARASELLAGNGFKPYQQTD